MNAPDDYLMRFRDGPMAGRQNIGNAAGTSGNVTVKSTVFSWPLPDRLGVLCHPGVANVAFWDADDPAEAKLPEAITGSSNALVYAKVSESEIPAEKAAAMSHVVIGAEYALETETTMAAIRERHGTEPGTLEEFEAEHGPVQPPDGEG